MKIVIIDYGAGNIHSLMNSVKAVTAVSDEVILSANASEIYSADRLILPGVGAFHSCRGELLARRGVNEAIYNYIDSDRPFMGICVGMQMLVENGFEHGIKTEGFGLMNGTVNLLEPSDPNAKIPHMGWNNVNFRTEHPIFEGISDGTDFYFVHSYAVKNTDFGQAYTDYYDDVVAVIGRDNIIGTQFHPEKSQKAGLKLLSNFLNWTP